MTDNTRLTTESFQAVNWVDEQVRLLDQRLLPDKETYLTYSDPYLLADAISNMVVRGAPAIGITAAYGVVLAARKAFNQDPHHWQAEIQSVLDYLANARPTAVNLFWAIRRMQSRFAGIDIDTDPCPGLLEEAMSIHQEDVSANIKMGELGADEINQTNEILTHCNAGALATGGYGTALGVVRSLYNRGNLKSVFATETRPWFQGARLTAWELLKDSIPVTLITDHAASHLFSQGRIQWVVIGADRIAANGDVVNKIGTYALAISARYHGIRFMVVAPTSTIDLNMDEGKKVPIEDRQANEVLNYRGLQIGPENASVWNPAFDITPADLVDIMVTERGVIHRPNQAKIRTLFN